MVRHVVIASLLISAAALAQDSTVSAFSAPGTRAYDVVPEASDDIPAAIERSVRHMSFITRPIARHRLLVTNPLPQHLQFDVTPDTITVRLGDEPPAALPRDGTAVPWRSLGGDKCRISAALAGDTLTEHVVAGGGKSETRYIVSDSGRRVRRDVRISSSHLPQPVEYSVTFVKAP